MSKELEKAIEECKEKIPPLLSAWEREIFRRVIEAAERDLELSKEYPLTTKKGGKE